MTTYVFFADAEHKRRADGVNTLIVQGADEAAARSAGEGLIGQIGALAQFAAVALTTASPAFVVEGHPPVGSRHQTVWPTHGRSGGPLRGA